MNIWHEIDEKRIEENKFEALRNTEGKQGKV